MTRLLIRDDLDEKLTALAQLHGCSTDSLLESLLDEHHVYRLIAQNAPDTTLILNAQQVAVEYMNQPSLLGHTLADLQQPGGFMGRVHPHDLEQVRTHWEMLTHAGDVGPYEIIFRMQARDGQWHCLQSRSRVPQRDSSGQVVRVVATLVDVTDRMAIEEALVESETRYRALVENLPGSAVILYNREMRCLLVAGPETHRLSYPHQDVVGKLACETMSPEMYDLVAPRLQAALAGETVVVEEQSRLNRQMYWKTYLPLKNADDEVSHVMVLLQNVTERKQAEENLREHERRMQAVISQVPIILFGIDPDGTVSFVEGSGLALLGVSQQEVIGHSAFQLFSHNPVVVEAMRQCLAGNDVREEQKVDGMVFDVSYTPVRGPGGDVTGISGVAVDVTQRAQIADEVEAAHTLLRTLIDHLPDLVFIKDLDGRFIISNRAHTHTLGFEHEYDVLGRTAADFVPEELASGYAADDVYVTTTGEALLNKEEQIFSTEGARWHLTTKVPLRDPQGNITGVIGISRDITGRKQAESQALALAVEREQTRMLSSFLQSASHEFRTPLANINAKAYLLGFESEPEQQKLHLDSIREQVTKIVRLVDALVTMNRLQLRVDDQKHRWHRLQVNDMLRGLCMGYQPAFEEKALALHTDFAADMPPLTGDADDFRLVFSELIDNAIRFTPEGGSITVRTRQDERGLIAAFSDTGEGIAPEHLPRVFERFYKSDSLGAKSGFGLGLAIAAKIVEVYNGRIDVESEPGAGSTFTVILPLKAEELE